MHHDWRRQYTISTARVLVLKFGCPRFKQRLEFVYSGPEFNSSTYYLNSQLVSLKPVGIFNKFFSSVYYICISIYRVLNYHSSTKLKTFKSFNKYFDDCNYDQGVSSTSNLQDRCSNQNVFSLRQLYIQCKP